MPGNNGQSPRRQTTLDDLEVRPTHGTRRYPDDNLISGRGLIGPLDHAKRTTVDRSGGVQLLRTHGSIVPEESKPE